MNKVELLCGKCHHNRVCGEKKKYEQYFAELNALHKKYDMFEEFPTCPEYSDKERVEEGLSILDIHNTHCDSICDNEEDCCSEGDSKEELAEEIMNAIKYFVTSDNTVDKILFPGMSKEDIQKKKLAFVEKNMDIIIKTILEN